MVDNFGDWLLKEAKPLFSVLVGGTDCQRLWTAAVADNTERLRREDIR
jgi:hypothetical protein